MILDHYQKKLVEIKGLIVNITGIRRELDNLKGPENKQQRREEETKLYKNYKKLQVDDISASIAFMEIINGNSGFADEFRSDWAKERKNKRLPQNNIYF